MSDSLHAEVLVCALRLRIELLLILVARRDVMQKTKLSAVGEAVRRLRAAADHDAEKVLKRVEELDSVRQHVNTRIHEHLDDHRAELAQIEQEFAELQEALTNGGPPIDDGAKPSAQQPLPQEQSPDPIVNQGGHAASMM